VISLPMRWSETGLPVGVQLVARFGDYPTLVRLASQLEQARPWQERKPPVHSSR
jgi:amidase